MDFPGKSTGVGCHCLLQYSLNRAFQVALVVKNPPANTGDTRDAGSILGSGRSPGERKGYPLQYSGLENSMDCIVHVEKAMHPTPVLLPGKSHGQRSLVGCSPWDREESDTTERLHFHFSLLCIGEGNGNPLQCSCLENPRDGGAWWAAIYGVAQSQK